MNFKGLRDRIAFETGRPYDQNNINPGNRTMAQQYMESVTPGAKKMQQSLVNLLGGPNAVAMDDPMARMAANENMLKILQAMPAAGVVGGVVGAGDVIAGEESFANKGMDMLAMVPGGLYGMRNKGTMAGRIGGALLGAGIGKLGSDAVQGGIGGIL